MFILKLQCYALLVVKVLYKHK